MRSNRVCCLLLIVLAIGAVATASPDLQDGVAVLFLLCDPFGANTGLLWSNFERLGWDVTIVGTDPVVNLCSPLTTTVTAQCTVDEAIDLRDYAVVAISPTPGTYAPRSDPAGDLLGSQDALRLIERADSLGLTLYAGCSSLLVLDGAGVLAGHDIVHHSRLRSIRDTADAASYTVGDANHPPMASENVVTATNQRFFALEIPEAIARSLDLARSPSAASSVGTAQLSWSRTAVEPVAAVVDAAAWGTPSSEGALDVCAYEDGFVLTGYTYAASRGADVLVARFDGRGECLWSTAYGGAGREVGHAISVLPDGRLAVAGYTTSIGNGGEDALLLLLGSDGQIDGVRSYGGGDHDAAFGLCVTKRGKLVLTGTTHSFDATFSAVYTVCATSDGTEIWSALHDGARYERGHAVVERQDGRLVVAGGTASSGAGNYDMLLVGYSREGEELWTQTLGRSSYDIAEQLVLAADGDLLVVGYGDLEGSDPNDVKLYRLGPDCEQRWDAAYGPRRSFDYGEDVLELDDGRLLVCGASGADGTGRSDVWLLCYSAEGERLWDQRFGEFAGSEWANALCRLADGRIVVVGWSRSHGAGRQDVLALTVDPMGTP